MTDFNVVIDTSRFEKRLTKLERQQLPFARSLAANQSAFETRATMQKSMGLFIDQPTPFTVRGVQYKRGTKAKPVAEVFISDDKPPKGTSRARYLTITRGGRRGQRRSEALLARRRWISQTEAWVPAAIKLNRFGNVPASRLTQILSGIKAFEEVGFQANITPASRARGVKKGRAEYFMARRGHLQRAIYQRHGRRKRAKHKYRNLPAGRQTVQRKIKPILIFVPLPRYRKTFDFQALAAKEARRRFVRAWPAALRRAVKTARR